MKRSRTTLYDKRHKHSEAQIAYEKIWFSIQKQDDSVRGTFPLVSNVTLAHVARPSPNSHNSQTKPVRMYWSTAASRKVPLIGGASFSNQLGLGTCNAGSERAYLHFKMLSITENSSWCPSPMAVEQFPALICLSMLKIEITHMKWSLWSSSRQQTDGTKSKVQKAVFCAYVEKMAVSYRWCGSEGSSPAWSHEIQKQATTLEEKKRNNEINNMGTSRIYTLLP